MIYNFFSGFICNFFKNFALGIKFCMIRYPILIFQQHFFRSYLYFLETLKPKKEETANNIENLYAQMFLRILFCIFIPVNHLILLKSDVITVPYSASASNKIQHNRHECTHCRAMCVHGTCVEFASKKEVGINCRRNKINCAWQVSASKKVTH